jgi:hypothetical protein
VDIDKLMLQLVSLFILFSNALVIVGFAVLIYGKYFDKFFLIDWRLRIWMMVMVTLLIGYLSHEYFSVKEARELGRGVVFYGLFLMSTPALILGFLTIFLKP